MGEKDRKILPIAVAEEICASKYGNDMAKTFKDTCYKMQDLKMQIINELPPQLIYLATYKFVWALLYHLPPENQVKFLQACIEEIKEKGKEWGE